MPRGRKILRSTVVLSVGQLLVLGLNLASTVVIARTVGEESFGYFAWLLAMLSILAILPDFGMSPIVLREFSRDRDDVGILLGTALAVRTGLLLISAILFTLVGAAVGLGMLSLLLVNLLLVNVIVSSKLTIHRHSLESVFRSQLRMEIPMALSIVDGLVLLAAALLLLHPGSSVSTLVVVYTAANLPGFLVLVFLVLRRERVRLLFRTEAMRILMRWSLPVGIYSGITAISMNSDVLLLRFFRGDAEVGVYAAATRFAFPLMFLPSSVVFSLFPAFSDKEGWASGSLDIGFRMGIKLLLLAGLMLGVFGVFLADDVIGLFYGSRYAGAGAPLRILLWSMMLSFLSFLLTNVNIAVDRQVDNAYYAALVCCVSIGLNLVLIPAWGAVGSASARLVAEAIGCVFLASRIRSVIHVGMGVVLVRGGAFAGGLAGVLLLLQNTGPVAQVVGGGVAAVGLLFGIGMFSRAETERFRVALLGGRH